MKCLHSTVFDGRNTERACLAVLLGNMHALEWFGGVAALFERVYGLCLFLRVVPGYSIDARRAFPLVFRHSSHGKRFAAERAGQQALQGLDLAPSAILRGLHDTRLEPPHVCDGDWFPCSSGKGDTGIGVPRSNLRKRPDEL